MASKTNSPGDDSADALKDSAEKIWLAGLGAFERMKAEGPRMFETLVEQGRNMSARAKDAADQALRTMREANYEGSGRWEKLQQDLQERMTKSLGSLGVTTAREVEALSRQVAELNEQVRNLMAAGARAGGRKPSRTSSGTARKSGATKKAPAKRRAKAARAR